jgi:hypothetical protein
MKLAVWLLGIAAAFAATPGTVEGTVSNSVTGAPVRKALVTLRFTAQYSGREAMTDSAGHFRIDNVEPGAYAIFATANGYVTNIPDISLDPPPANAVSVSDGQAVKDLALRLVPNGAISGRVLDENGDPIPGIAVEALRFTYSGDRKELHAQHTATTNDRGEYRLFDVVPGRWYLEVSRYVGIPAVPGRVHSTVVEEGYPATFFPGVTESSAAAAIDVAPGADLRQIDVRVRRSRVYHLRGVTSAGAVVYGSRCNDDRGAFAALKASPAGAFDFRGLGPGCYSISSAMPGPPKMVAPARQVYIADRDVDDLAFRLEPAFSIQGTILLEESSPDKLARARVTLEPVGANAAPSFAVISADGSFTLDNLAPASYAVRVAPAPGLYLKSAHLGNVDISADCRLDATRGAGPLTIVMRGDGGKLTGNARPAVAWLPLRVTVAPEGAPSARFDLLHTVWPESDGSFHVDGLAPGDYKVFAWQTDNDGLTESAEFRKLFEGKATSVTVTANGLVTSEVRTITASEIEEARGRLR